MPGEMVSRIYTTRGVSYEAGQSVVLDGEVRKVYGIKRERSFRQPGYRIYFEGGGSLFFGDRKIQDVDR